jgi:RNA polymerase sigma-70 factor (ECF subfamily)
MLEHRDPRLGARLVELLPDDQKPAAVPSHLDAVLVRALAAARTAWPDVALSNEAFLAHLARCVPRGADLIDALDALALTDLFLACACAHREPHALAHFDAHYLTPVGRAWSGGHRLAASADEVRQALRVRLLVGADGEPPRIASYAGRGALAAWVRMSATRLALNMLKSEGRHAAEPEDDDAVALRAAQLDPELEYLKTRYATELSDALRAALAGLPARAASVLRLHYQQGMTVDAIGTMYRASGRTVQRWLAEARHAILADTRRLLHERVGLADSQLDSLIALVRSRLDISIYRHLGPA